MTTVPAEGAPEMDFTWELWLARRTGLPYLLHGLLVAAVVAASFFLPMWLLGFLPLEMTGLTSDLPVDPYSWGAIAASLLAGFAASALPYVTERRMCDLSELAPVVPSLDCQGLRDLYAKAAASAPRLRWGITLAAALAGFLVPYSGTPGAAEVARFDVPAFTSDMPKGAYVGAAWFLLIGPPLLASLARSSFIIVHGGHVFFRALDGRIEVDPLDADALRPLAKAGLRTALVLCVGVAIGVLFLFNSDIDPEAIEVALGVVLILAVLSAVSPALVGAQVLRQAKQTALHPLRGAISRARDRSVAPDADDAAVARLGALLAYEQRLMEARELPIDMPAVGQLAFYLTIPVVSWLGGAFVERMVDAALG